MTVSTDEMRRIADEAAQATVREMLTAMGVDMSSPEKIIQAPVDFAYLRRSRRASERVAAGVRTAILAAAVSGALTILWMGFKMAVTSKGGG